MDLHIASKSATTADSVELTRPSRKNLVVALLFFGSGASGLIYEVLWARYLALYLGSTAYAHANNSAKQTTKEAVLQAAIALKAAGLSVTQQSVAIRSNVSLLTVKNHWSEVDAQLGLYKKRAWFSP